MEKYVYRTEKEQNIIDIVKKAVRKLNKKKGTTLKVYDMSFGLGVDHDYNPDSLSTSLTLTIQNTSNKKTIKLHYYESFFDANWPDNNDDKSGANRVSKAEDKVLLRISYSIWFYSRRIAK